MRRAIALLPFLLLFAPQAHAATAEVTAGALRITATPGEYNAITVAPSATGLAISDAGAPLTAGHGCIPEGVQAICTGATRIEANLGDGDDALMLSAPLPADLEGGEGNDTLTVVAAAVAAPAAAATLTGGEGNDALTSATGAD